MKAKSFDLSGKIESSRIEVFRAIARVAESLSIPFFVVGATARDVIFTERYGIRTIRATKDVDFGVQVENWSQFEKLKESLVATGQFAQTEEPQRLKYADAELVDIIPFGNIAASQDSFSWPPDHEVVMNMVGFDEAYEHSLTVRLSSDPVLDVRFTGLAGLALMKIIAWNDNYARRKRDAKDLSFIIAHYHEAGNLERLLDRETELVEQYDFDYELAGARLLGRDIAAISRPRSIETVLEILNRETDEESGYRLVAEMTDPTDDFDQKLGLLVQLKLGILDKTTKS